MTLIQLTYGISSLRSSESHNLLQPAPFVTIPNYKVVYIAKTYKFYIKIFKASLQVHAKVMNFRIELKFKLQWRKIII